MAEPEVKPQETPVPAPAPKPAAPSAASTVLSSNAKESDASEIVEARRQLEEEKAARKKEQCRIAELEDENRTLKAPPKRESAQKKSWIEGGSIFD